MKYWLSAVVAACLVLAPMAGQAATAKKHHHRAPMPQATRAPAVVDPTGGNAALQGNNATSMFGSNSAADNANGRTSGGGGYGR
jgi:hypothetical protein